MLNAGAIAQPFLLRRLLDIAQRDREADVFAGERVVAVSLDSLVADFDDIERHRRTVLLLGLQRHARLRCRFGRQVLARDLDDQFIATRAKSACTSYDRSRPC